MPGSTTSGQEPRWLDDEEAEAWRSYAEASVALLDVLDRELQARHSLSLRDYEVLVRLSEAEGRRMRMADLAEQIQDSSSCLSHRIDRLVHDGIVVRKPDPLDRRGRLARLTAKGLRVLERASIDHVSDVRRLFVDVLSADELRRTARTFRRIAGTLTAERETAER